MQLEKKVIIYCLIDPITCKVRYIGRTTKKNIKHRLIEHITKSRYFSHYYPNKKNTHKVNWINSLLKKGEEPKIRKLCEVIGWEKSHFLERCLIKKYLLSRDLTNIDDKGTGEANKVITDEQKQKISNKLKAHYLTNINARSKSIDVYDSDGNYLKTYVSANSFAKLIGVSPSKVSKTARGLMKRVKGYQIKYTDDIIRVIDKYSATKKKPYTSKKLRKLIKVTNVLTNEDLTFLGIEECCKQLGIPRYTYYNHKKKNKTFEIGKYRFVTI
jgi:hypothetical protein